MARCPQAAATQHPSAPAEAPGAGTAWGRPGQRLGVSTDLRTVPTETGPSGPPRHHGHRHGHRRERGTDRPALPKAPATAPRPQCRPRLSLCWQNRIISNQMVPLHRPWLLATLSAKRIASVFGE